MYREVTRGIEVVVEPHYVAEQSVPESRQFFFSYRVQISNLGGEAAQLVSRHWQITDGYGQSHEVRGPGVVGETPVIRPGETYEYSSYCPLPTPTGNMRGTFQMVGAQGEEFNAKIPLFFLRDLRPRAPEPSHREAGVRPASIGNDSSI